VPEVQRSGRPVTAQHTEPGRIDGNFGFEFGGPALSLRA
jgi:hypothetical protein